ncbi:MAG: ubiquinol-cytochrome c reductase iron-sulfur subunit [Pirellulales bacterium]
MAEKKKLSVAEIMAAARKADSKGAAAPGSKPPAEPKPASEPVEAQSAQAASAGQEPVQQVVEQPAAAAPAPKSKPPAGGAKPSVAEILAMARAQAKDGQPPQPAAAPKPAAEVRPAKPAAVAAAKTPKPAPAEKPAAVAAVAGGKDTASILAAARKTTRPGPMSKAEAAARLKPAPERPAKAPAAKAPAAVPPMPARPDYARRQPAKDAAVAAEDRRWFLSVALGSFLGIGFTSLATTLGLWTLGLARFMFPNILTEPPSRFKVGFPGDFPPGAVEEKFKALFGVWVVNAEYQGEPQIFALRTVCTHLGCTPNWLDAEQKFKCPCHGSGFYKDGINFEGPAPRPLERYAISLADDGQLEIDKSKLFQEEMGQWNDPASFVPV